MKNEDINKMSYTDFISLIQEENRPSGGKKTIREIVQNTFVNSESKVLEIGCTNGFSSIEINRLVNCNVVGVDINEKSVANANNKIDLYNLDHKKVKFLTCDATNLPFNDNEFDLIIFGNALSFIQDKDKAMKECMRVLKNDGFISLVPIWYKNEIDYDIVDRVNKVLGFEIKCTFNKDWENFEKDNLELYYKKDYEFIKQSSENITNYVNEMIDSKEHLNELDDSVKQTIKRRWFDTISTFNDNLAMTQYSIILLRKTPVIPEVEIIKTTA